MDELAKLRERAEQVGIEDPIAEGPVEAFDVGVLGGFARLDVMEVNAVALAPGDELGGDEFRAVVDADLLWQGMAFLELFEEADDTFGRERGFHFGGLAHTLVEDVEGAEAFPAEEGVAH